MPSTKKFLGKIPLLTNGEALIGLVFVLAGILVARYGVLRLWSLWLELSPHFPFSLPPDTAQWIQQSFPLIFNLFITTISSLCAVLIGAFWALGGLWQALESRKRPAGAPDFRFPELVAESLRTAQPRHWQKTPWLASLLSLVWPRARLMSPVSFEIFREVLASLWMIAFGAVVIYLVTFGLNMIPALAKQYFNHTITLVVPSARPLYSLLVLVAVLDLVIALTLVPMRRRPFTRRNAELPIWGWGSPQVFFALIEEGCRLLTPKGNQERRPLRMQDAKVPQIKGTLIETNPSLVSSIGRPAAYVCLPLVVYFLVHGFSRLIHFDQPVSSIPYRDFFAHSSLNYVLDIAYAFGLILCGHHFAERTRRLFNIRRFHSALVFCHVSRGGSAPETDPGMPDRRRRRSSHPAMAWRVVTGGDDQLALWARQPKTMGRFRLEIFWSEIFSEAAGHQGLRHVAGMDLSEELDAAMARIVALPCHVDLKQGEPTPATTPGTERPAGSADRQPLSQEDPGIR